MMMAILKDFRGRLDYKAERLKLAAQWGATHGSTKRAAMELSAYLFLPTARGGKTDSKSLLHSCYTISRRGARHL
jgi:hypothetical protein